MLHNGVPADRRSFVGIRRSGVLLLCGMALGSGATISRARAGGLKESLGRNEVRVYGAPYRIEFGTSVDGARIVERLEYTRVHSRLAEIGQYFWGTTSFWIYRRPFRYGGAQFEPALLGLDLNGSYGRILGSKDSAGSRGSKPLSKNYLAPLQLASSFPSSPEFGAVDLAFRIGETKTVPPGK